MKRNWSSPKRNIIAGMLDLRSALAAGQNAKLIKMRNEDCEYPIKYEKEDKDFRNYQFSIGFGSSVNKIKEMLSLSAFEKHLSLNYMNCFGTDEAVKKYYETGELSEDNIKSMGRSHLVNVDDLIKHLRENNDIRRANLYERQYRSPEHVDDTVHFFDFYRYKHGSRYAVKEFKRKLWVVVILGEDEQKPRIPVLVHVLNVILYPLKFVPTKTVLDMDEYKCVTYRVGSITNGFAVEFQIPKKFSFK